MELQMMFGANVRNHRKAKALTQENLAELVDVSVETISKIERGVAAPTFATAELLAKALGVPTPSLFGVTGLPSGDRGKLLTRINKRLASFSDDELSRLSKMIDAFAGK